MSDESQRCDSAGIDPVIRNVEALTAAPMPGLNRTLHGACRDFQRIAGFVAALVSALGASALPLRAQQTSPKPITLGALIDSMEARQKLADSVTVRWNQSERYAAGAFRKDPSEFTFPCEILLKGSSMHYVSKTFSHPDIGERVTLIDHVSSYDGNESRFFQGTTPRRGRILEEKANTDARLYTLLPFRLYFRPLVETYGTLKRRSMKLLDDRKIIDGHECVTVDDGRLRVCLDRDRDFAPVVFQAFGRNGMLYFEGNIEYYRADKGPLRWLPKAFQVISHVPGLAVRTLGDAVQTTIGGPLKKSEFALTFEPGTVVWDARTGEEYRICDDGSKEPIEKRRPERADPKQGR